MTIEFAVLVVVLVVPLFYLVATVGRVQAGAYAASAAAREAGRTYVTADDPASASVRADAALALVLASHGFEPDDGVVTVSCPEGVCLAAGSSIVVDAEVRVPLPLVPDFARAVLPTDITLTSTHRESVDEFRAGG